ncbi:hypothetical protein POM88_021043 [Heracleum sosnowskyi]|uniref:Uncharacterized protein n=1 Tax=Heracleum sosnowskyi TaxID=360622 RepID=A0AAD8IF64_9APIA|nr:hypothetical protein POM88_021043 [Heracleum sosnowskyi]
MDFSNVVAQEDTSDVDGELLSLSNSDGASPKAVPSIWTEDQSNRAGGEKYSKNEKSHIDPVRSSKYSGYPPTSLSNETGWMKDFPRAVKHFETVFGEKSGRKFKTDN